MPTPLSTRRTAVTLGLAVGVFGISFGVVGTGIGLSGAMVCAMSLLVFTGATQFAAVGVLASGGSPIAALGSALLLGARHIGYGMALRTKLDPRLGRRLLAAQFLIDESTVLALTEEEPGAADGAFWWGGLSVFVGWNLGTVLGVVLGDAIGDPATFGLDAVFPAAFLALVVPLLRRRDGRAVTVAAVVIALTLVPFVPAGIPVIASAAGVLVALALRAESPPPPELPA